MLYYFHLYMEAIPLRKAARLSMFFLQMGILFLTFTMIVSVPACAAGLPPHPSELQLNQEVVHYRGELTLRYYNADDNGWIGIYPAGSEELVAVRELDPSEGSVSFQLRSDGLTPGSYTAVLYQDRLTEAARQDFSVVRQNFYAGQEVYDLGSDGYFYYDEDVADADKGAWIGIYPADGDPAAMRSLLWGYLPDGSSQIYTDDLDGNGERFSSLPAGEYQAVLFLSEDGEPYRSFYFSIEEPEVIYAVYRRSDSALPNTAEGEVVLYGNSSAGRYWLYWGDEDGLLEDYLPLGSITEEDGWTFTLHPNQEAPAGSTRIYLYPGSSSGPDTDAAPVTVVLPDDITAEPDTLLTSFVVMTDTHVSKSTSFIYNRTFKQAMEDIIETMPEAEFMINLGDTVNNGWYSEYQMLQRLIKRYQRLAPEQYFLMGNHDMLLNKGDPEIQIQMWEEATGMPNVYYSFVKQGYSFIVLGSEGQEAGELATDEAWFSEDQLSWLKEELAAAEARDPDLPIFVFCHQPLQDTGPGTNNSLIIQNDELEEILREYPQVVYFSGHTHYSMDADGVVLTASDGKPNTVHGGCSSYLWDDDGAYDGSEGCLVEIYPDYIRIRGRNFAEGSWMGSAQYILYMEE